MVNTDSTWKQLTGIQVIRAKDGLNNSNGYTHSEAINPYQNNPILFIFYGNFYAIASIFILFYSH